MIDSTIQEIKQHPKYIVLKTEDVEKYGWETQKMYLRDLCEEINKGRIEEGKKLNSYIVINMDEPYINEVIEILKRHGHWEG